MSYGFRHNNAGKLAKYLDCVRALTDETPMAITTDSIYFNVMDPLHISMITMNLPVETFGIDENLVKGEKLTINFPDFWGIFEEADGEKASLSCEEGWATWALSSRKGMMDIVRTITAPIPDGIEDEPPPPTLPYKNEVVVPSKILLRELSEFEPYTHTTLFIEEGDSLILYAEIDALPENGVKRNTIKCRSGESAAFKVNKNEDNSVATYTTDFLLSYVKPLSELFDTIRLQWSEDAVLHIKGAVSEPLLVRYLLAPNVGVTPKVKAK